MTIDQFKKAYKKLQIATSELQRDSWKFSTLDLLSAAEDKISYARYALENKANAAGIMTSSIKRAMDDKYGDTSY